MTDDDIAAAGLASRGREGDAGELLAALRRLILEGKVALAIEAKRLGHIDSPVAVEADGNIWAYGLLAIAVVVGWRWGILPGLAALAIGVVVYLSLGRAYVNRRIERRVRQVALADVDKWRKLWQFGGLTLSSAEAPRAACASPDGNWMAFVRDRRGSEQGSPGSVRETGDRS